MNDVPVDGELGEPFADETTVAEPAATEAPTIVDVPATSKLATPIVWLIDIVIGAAIALLVVFAIGKYRDRNDTATTAITTAAPQTQTTGSTAKPGTGGPPMVIDTAKKYTATIATNYGKILIELDAKNAPTGTNNFVVLARKGFFDNTTIHRTVANFVIQGGSPDGSGNGGPGYTMQAESPKSPYKLGDIAYAKTGNDPAGSASSQWFIVTGSTASLDQTIANGAYAYARFGHVVDGLEVAEKIEALAPPTAEGGPPTKPVKVNKVTISEA